MRTRDNIIYTLTHREFYETINRYEPIVAEHIAIVQELLGPDWKFSRGNVWMQCASAQSEYPAQGWKIHISATGKNGADILRAVVPVLRSENVSFKFALDQRMLVLLNSKNWHRGGSGKFITIYPSGQQQFLSLLESLNAVTSHFEGPYILSDRRYKNSRVLFYRYGGLRRIERFSVEGEMSPVIKGPAGEDIVDERTPYFHLPSWVSDPFPPEEVEEQDAAGTLKQGRYSIGKTLSFSNSGGVYLATDRSIEQQVIIKEARPWANWMTSGDDAISLLKKEYRLLKKLEGTGICARAIDLFQDWEHFYLVEEYLPGLSLRNYSVLHTPVLDSKLTRESVELFYSSFYKIFASIAHAIAVLHRHDIVFADLSPNNVIVNDETLQCCIIDFEAACELGKDKTTRMFTPGYGRLTDNRAIPETDYYALGAMMLSFIMPINPILDLKPQAGKEWLDSIATDIGIPRRVSQTILELIDDDPAKRPSITMVTKILEDQRAVEYETRPENLPPEEGIAGIIGRGREYILTVADLARSDRLFPADARVFSTNPLSLAYGACGVALALKYVSGDVPSEIIQWIVKRDAGSSQYPPGLFIGASGIAWALFELGLHEEAEDLMRRTQRHPLLEQSSDIFYGIAGWGLAELYFFLKTKKACHLDGAVRAADVLCKNAQRDGEANLYWGPASNVPLGFAEGGSGIALFLLYVFLATGERRYLHAAERALQFDIAHAIKTRDGGFSWSFTTGPNSILLPYWRYGSAGVGVTVLRFHKLFPDRDYKSILDKIHIDTDRKYSVTVGMFNGLAGIGEFLLDSYEFLKDKVFLERAYKVADGIKLFAIERDLHIAFPGRGLSKICCDYGTGSAGVILFLNRLVTGRRFTITLDDLFHQQEEAVVSERKQQLQ